MTSRLSVERLRREGEQFMEELSREYYDAHSGLKPTADLQPVYAKHRDILGADALAAAREYFEGSTDGSEDYRSARLLLDWQVDAQSSRELAPLDEREIAWEADAVATTADGRRIPYQRVAIEIGNSTDRNERAMLEQARKSLVQTGLAPLRRERFQRERDITESLGLAPNYNATWELLSGVSLTTLRDECAAFLRDTQVPINMSVFESPVSVAAWRDKPTWAVIAADDKSFDQAMLQHMAKRIGATVTNVPGSHALFMTQAAVVSEVIATAARNAA